jgi:hypothetical protein
LNAQQVGGSGGRGLTRELRQRWRRGRGRCGNGTSREPAVAVKSGDSGGGGGRQPVLPPSGHYCVLPARSEEVGGSCRQVGPGPTAQ